MFESCRPDQGLIKQVPHGTCFIKFGSLVFSYNKKPANAGFLLNNINNLDLKHDIFAGQFWNILRGKCNINIAHVALVGAN